MTETELRQHLATLDAERATLTAQADQALQATRDAQSTAGNEFNAEIAAADQAVIVAQTEGETTLNQVDTNRAAAQAATNQVETPTSIADQISAIQHMEPVTVPTGGTPDCSAQQVQDQINMLIGAINTQIDLIKTALAEIDARLTGPNTAKLREAAEKTNEAVGGLRSLIPPVIDTEAEKAAKRAIVNGMFP